MVEFFFYNRMILCVYWSPALYLQSLDKWYANIFLLCFDHYIYIYILSVYSPFSDRVGLPLHNIHNPSPFTDRMCARRARLCVWIGLTNILFIDESMAVQMLFFGFIIWNYSWVRYNT